MTTPMRQQYLSLKGQYSDCILFFRLGDFYETFDDDAKIVAKVCDVVLTSRPVGNDQRVPLAGVPYHAVDGYVARLIEAGYRVAIAEQMSEPGQRAGRARSDACSDQRHDCRAGDARREAQQLPGGGEYQWPRHHGGYRLLRHHHRRICRHRDQRSRRRTRTAHRRRTQSSQAQRVDPHRLVRRKNRACTG